MTELTPRFSATRAVTEYTEKYYLPAARNYLTRKENGAALAQQMVYQLGILEEQWIYLRFGKTKVDGQSYETEIYLGAIDPPRSTRAFCRGDPPEVYTMQQKSALQGSSNTYIYAANYPHYALLMSIRYALELP